MRIVIDSNVLISSFLLENSLPAQLIDHVLAEHTLILSEAIIEEVARVLHRKKFRKYITEDNAQKLLREIVERCTLVQIEGKIEVCRDPKDNYILETALSGKAHTILSGDNDLLVLHPFREILIISPKAF